MRDFRDDCKSNGKRATGRHQPPTRRMVYLLSLELDEEDDAGLLGGFRGPVTVGSASGRHPRDCPNLLTFELSLFGSGLFLSSDMYQESFLSEETCVELAGFFGGVRFCVPAFRAVVNPE